MKSFRHATDDGVEFRSFVEKHGAKGYALYFYVLECITRDISAYDYSCRLHESASDIAKFLKIKAQGGKERKSAEEVVSSMLDELVALGLLEKTGGVYYRERLLDAIDFSSLMKAVARVRRHRRMVVSLDAEKNLSRTFYPDEAAKESALRESEEARDESSAAPASDADESKKKALKARGGTPPKSLFDEEEEAPSAEHGEEGESVKAVDAEGESAEESDAEEEEAHEARAEGGKKFETMKELLARLNLPRGADGKIHFNHWREIPRELWRRFTDEQRENMMRVCETEEETAKRHFYDDVCARMDSECNSPTLERFTWRDYLPGGILYGRKPGEGELPVREGDAEAAAARADCERDEEEYARREEAAMREREKKEEEMEEMEEMTVEGEREKRLHAVELIQKDLEAKKRQVARKEGERKILVPESLEQVEWQPPEVEGVNSSAHFSEEEKERELRDRLQKALSSMRRSEARQLEMKVIKREEAKSEDEWLRVAQSLEATFRRELKMAARPYEAKEGVPLALSSSEARSAV